MVEKYTICIRTKDDTFFKLGPFTLYGKLKKRDIRSAIRTMFSVKGEPTFPSTEVEEIVVVIADKYYVEILEVKISSVWPKEFDKIKEVKNT